MPEAMGFSGYRLEAQCIYHAHGSPEFLCSLHNHRCFLDAIELLSGLHLQAPMAVSPAGFRILLLHFSILICPSTTSRPVSVRRTRKTDINPPHTHARLSNASTHTAVRCAKGAGVHACLSHPSSSAGAGVRRWIPLKFLMPSYVFATLFSALEYPTCV